MNYLDAQEAVGRSISHNERARLFAREDLSGWTNRVAATISELGPLGLEDWTRENNGTVDAWGKFEGHPWRVLIIDGFEEH